MDTQLLDTREQARQSSWGGRHVQDNDTAQESAYQSRRADVYDPQASDQGTESLAQTDIACLAYAIWEARGCPDGCAEDNWYEAQRRLINRRKGLADDEPSLTQTFS